ncbi:MAG: 50S ribosomal protein L25 [Kiritimatiellae bacterium]|nr:50S ribosomal protein L25 [Kiritimatiellia bacterium]MDD4341838.1 50S ribosomal protein L25 [Kiritimatiellia bacterium]
MKKTKLIAQLREAKGSAASGRLRRTGWVPAVAYGEGRPGLDIQLNEHDFVMLLRDHRSENMILDLEVEGMDKISKVMVKALQHHPITGRIIHADLYEVSMSRTISIEVPVKLVGVPIGVAQHGGLLEHVMRTVAMECLPGDVIDELELDVTNLNVGDILRVEDVKVDAAKHKLLDELDQVIVAVAAPRLEEETAEEEAEAEAEAGEASPEVLTEKKEEEGEKAQDEKEKK